jgi:DNA mismatch repair ATPase MutS
VTISRTLGLTLSARGKGPGSMRMAGFPYHQLDAYLNKLVATGHRVAVCERVAQTGKLDQPIEYIETAPAQGRLFQ